MLYLAYRDGYQEAMGANGLKIDSEQDLDALIDNYLEEEYEI